MLQKKSQKTISIITPSFNQGKYLEETIRSVITQKGDFYIDYIVMDGGSTDSSVDILKKYADLVNEGNWEKKCLGIDLTWMSERDAGQTDAINKGFRKARGEVVSWINSDDMYFPGCFSVVLNHFSHHPDDDFVFGDGDVIDETGMLQWEWLSRSYDLKLLKSYHFLWNDFTNYIMQQATFWRRGVFDKIGLLDDSFHYAMDIEYWIRAGENGLRLAHIPRKLGKFRMVKGTKSFSSPTVFWPDYLEIYRRYRGIHLLSTFFSCYYYNLAIECEFNLTETRKRGEAIFSRWDGLTVKERRRIECKADWGFNMACLLLADYLRKNHRRGQAKSLFNQAIQKRPVLILHPYVLWYCLRIGMGSKLSRILDRLLENIISFYRRKFIDYRYCNTNRQAQ